MKTVQRCRLAAMAACVAMFAMTPWLWAQSSGLSKELTLDLGGGVKLEMVLIPAGSFEMGDASAENDDERPVHKVTIRRPFYLGKYEMTQEQWRTLMGVNPAGFPGTNHPADNVNWEDCQALVKKLNEKFAGQGLKFSLPTEAQWEYACRAGTGGAYSCPGKSPGDYAWTKDNAEDRPHAVGQKKPNPWGLYDIHGNLFEWCADWYAADYYARSPADDPTGPEKGANRVLRGGSWDYRAPFSRSAYRLWSPPSYRCATYGCRVACVR